jgi:hypothetical protein
LSSRASNARIQKNNRETNPLLPRLVPCRQVLVLLVWGLVAEAILQAPQLALQLSDSNKTAH